MASDRLQILYDFVEFAPAALAAQGVSGGTPRYQTTLTEDFRISKIEVHASVIGVNGNDMGILCLVAGDLSTTEIAECLNSAPVSNSDTIENEEAMRPVFPLGMLGGMGDAQALSIDKIIRWTFGDPDAWRYVIYNPDTGTAWTTGSTIRVFAKIYGVYVT